VSRRTPAQNETPMKTYRLITFVAAVLITVLIAQFLSDKKISVPPDEAQAAAAQAP